MSEKAASWMALLTVGMLACSSLRAQTVPPPPVATPVKHQLILMHWESLGGLRYYYDGIQVKGGDNLKTIISQLHDNEANRLLSNSRDENGVGTVALVGGLAMMTGGLILIGSDPNATSNSGSVDSQETTGSLLVLAGLVGDLIGGLKLADGRADEFNSVQRYNAVIYNNSATSWNLPKRGIQTELLTLKF